MELTARTLVLDLLTTVRRGAMPVRALVEAGALFGFAENNVRVSLSKLYAEGHVARDERGRYRLAKTTSQLAKRLQGWRRLEELHGAWSGGWVAVHAPRRGRGRVRQRRERALSLLGFRELEAGLAVRPDNLRGGLAQTRERFFAFASDEDADCRVFGLHGLDASAELRARSLWDADALTRGYAESRARLLTSHANVPALSEANAMVETFLVGNAVVRQLHLDPLLPEAILDPSGRRALADAMREYDELGRRAWAPFLTRHGVLTSAGPQAWRASLGEAPDSLKEIPQ